MAFKPEREVINKRPSFVFVNGKPVRNTKGKEIVIRSNVKGNSLAKFPKRIGAIGWHKWS